MNTYARVLACVCVWETLSSCLESVNFKSVRFRSLQYCVASLTAPMEDVHPLASGISASFQHVHLTPSEVGLHVKPIIILHLR